MNDTDWITLTLELEREDRAAILVRPPASEAAPVWLPRSQIDVAPDPVGRRLVVTLPLWLAQSKGLAPQAPDPDQGVLL